MRFYVYLIGFIVSVVFAVIGGIAFRFLEVDYESQTAEEAYAELRQLLGVLRHLFASEDADMRHRVYKSRYLLQRKVA